MNTKLYDVAAIGELLIDFTQNGESEQHNWMFEANPGGAPCNVLAMLQKLGHKTAFIGKVGDDMFGNMLKERVEGLGISTAGLVVTKENKTTLAFVHTEKDGDRDFSFYRNFGKNGKEGSCADAALKKKEVKKEIIADAKILHYGTLSMTNDTVNEATEYALSVAKKNNVLLSFDPNLRPPLWDTLAHAKERMLYGISQCDVLKIADEELTFVTGEDDIAAGVKKLRSKYRIPLISVTEGKKGCHAFFDDGNTVLDEQCPTFTTVKTIDTTGAGDTFGACVLHTILLYGYKDFTKERLHDMLVFANAASSLITTKKGALCVMPTETEIQNLINSI